MVEKPPTPDHMDERENKGKQHSYQASAAPETLFPQITMEQEKTKPVQKAPMQPKCCKNLPGSCRTNPYQRRWSLGQRLKTYGVGSSATEMWKKRELGACPFPVFKGTQHPLPSMNPG